MSKSFPCKCNSKPTLHYHTLNLNRLVHPETSKHCEEEKKKNRKEVEKDSSTSIVDLTDLDMDTETDIRPSTSGQHLSKESMALKTTTQNQASSGTIPKRIKARRQPPHAQQKRSKLSNLPLPSYPKSQIIHERRTIVLKNAPITTKLIRRYRILVAKYDIKCGFDKKTFERKRKVLTQCLRMMYSEGQGYVYGAEIVSDIRNYVDEKWTVLPNMITSEDNYPIFERDTVFAILEMIEKSLDKKNIKVKELLQFIGNICSVHFNKRSGKNTTVAGTKCKEYNIVEKDRSQQTEIFTKDISQQTETDLRGQRISSFGSIFGAGNLMRSNSLGEKVGAASIQQRRNDSLLIQEQYDNISLQTKQTLNYLKELNKLNCEIAKEKKKIATLNRRLEALGNRTTSETYKKLKADLSLATQTKEMLQGHADKYEEKITLYKAKNKQLLIIKTRDIDYRLKEINDQLTNLREQIQPITEKDEELRSEDEKIKLQNLLAEREKCDKKVEAENSTKNQWSCLFELPNQFYNDVKRLKDLNDHLSTNEQTEHMSKAMADISRNMQALEVKIEVYLSYLKPKELMETMTNLNREEEEDGIVTAAAAEAAAAAVVVVIEEEGERDRDIVDIDIGDTFQLPHQQPPIEARQQHITFGNAASVEAGQQHITFGNPAPSQEPGHQQQQQITFGDAELRRMTFGDAALAQALHDRINNSIPVGRRRRPQQGRGRVPSTTAVDRRQQGHRRGRGRGGNTQPRGRNARGRGGTGRRRAINPYPIDQSHDIINLDGLDYE